MFKIHTPIQHISTPLRIHKPFTNTPPPHFVNIDCRFTHDLLMSVLYIHGETYSDLWRQKNKTKQKQTNQTKTKQKNLLIALPTSQRPLFTPHILQHTHLTASIAFFRLSSSPPSLICQLMLVLIFAQAMSIISNYIFSFSQAHTFTLLISCLSSHKRPQTQKQVTHTTLPPPNLNQKQITKK